MNYKFTEKGVILKAYQGDGFIFSNVDRLFISLTESEKKELSDAIGNYRKCRAKAHQEDSDEYDCMKSEEAETYLSILTNNFIRKNKIRVMHRIGF